jgi:hypothetical protein
MMRTGWTLQELIAPQRIRFFDKYWRKIGSKTSWAPDLARITGIDIECLQDPWKLGWYPIAERFSWAARRRTTRIEDEAYCLLGLMEVNMPLLYGEGDRSFSRLCTELIRQSDDASIFNHNERFNALPSRVRAFSNPGYTIPLSRSLGRPNTINRPNFSVTNKGLILSNVIYIDLNAFESESSDTQVNLRLRLVLMPNNYRTSFLLVIGQIDELYGDWINVDMPNLSNKFATDEDLAKYFVENGRFTDERHCIRTSANPIEHNSWHRQAIGVDFRCCPDFEKGSAAVDFSTYA